MQGTDQPRRAPTPLPPVDPKVVAACKASNPEFGQARGRPAELRPCRPRPRARRRRPPRPKAAPAPRSGTGGKRPNIVFVLTDDLALNTVQFMPHVLEMQKQGVTFANYFVTDSLCCPSRSSIFTGRFPHDTGIFRNTGNDGGFQAFHNRHHEQMTFATALATAGYRTAMLGKYPQRLQAATKIRPNPVGAFGPEPGMATPASTTTSMKTAERSITARSRRPTSRMFSPARRSASSSSRLAPLLS